MATSPTVPRRRFRKAFELQETGPSDSRRRPARSQKDRAPKTVGLRTEEDAAMTVASSEVRRSKEVVKASKSSETLAAQAKADEATKQGPGQTQTHRMDTVALWGLGLRYWLSGS